MFFIERFIRSGLSDDDMDRIEHLHEEADQGLQLYEAIRERKREFDDLFKDYQRTVREARPRLDAIDPAIGFLMPRRDPACAEAGERLERARTDLHRAEAETANYWDGWYEMAAADFGRGKSFSFKGPRASVVLSKYRKEFEAKFGYGQGLRHYAIVLAKALVIPEHFLLYKPGYLYEPELAEREIGKFDSCKFYEFLNDCLLHIVHRRRKINCQGCRDYIKRFPRPCRTYSYSPPGGRSTLGPLNPSIYRLEQYMRRKMNPLDFF